MAVRAEDNGQKMFVMTFLKQLQGCEYFYFVVGPFNYVTSTSSDPSGLACLGTKHTSHCVKATFDGSAHVCLMSTQKAGDAEGTPSTSVKAAHHPS